MITLSSGPLRLAIDPALGAGISDFSIMGPSKYAYSLMRRAMAGETSSSSLACFSMVPYSNRIAGAKFAFGGVTHTLRPTSAPGVTPVVCQHGDVRNRPWTILDRSPISARLGFRSRDFGDVNFPMAFSSVVRYELRDDRLLIDLSVTNDDEQPMPAGCGLHPYFARRLWRDDDVVTFRAPCATRYPLKDGLPTGAPGPDQLVDHLREDRPLPGAHVDALLGGFSGECRIAWPASRVGLTMKCSPNLGHLVFFVPHGEGGPLPYFAVEPVTNANDGFNLLEAGHPGTGVEVLGPGATLTACYSLAVERW